MKACSFLPAVTRMIYAVELQHLLHGITFECPPKALEEKKVFFAGLIALNAKIVHQVENFSNPIFR